MAKCGRRRFLFESGKMALGAAAGTALLAAPRSSQAVSPNEKIVVGVVGIRGRGSALSHGLRLAQGLRGGVSGRRGCHAVRRGNVAAATRSNFPPSSAAHAADGIDKGPGQSAEDRAGLPPHPRRQVGRRGGRSPRPTIGTRWPRSGLARPARTCTWRSRSATAPGKAARWSRRPASTSASCRWARKAAAPPVMPRRGSTSRTASWERSTSAACST